MPICSLLLFTIVDLVKQAANVGSSLASTLALTTGKVRFCTNVVKVATPESNSWLPSVCEQNDQGCYLM